MSDRLYITLGMAGFQLVVPFHDVDERMDQAARQQALDALHWLIFPAVVLGMIHYYMAVKRDIRGPLVYALIFAVLFWNRLRKPAPRAS